MRSSQAAFDLIVAEEVSSQATYTKKYRKPEWPGESSGATIGIGYDLGQTAKATVISDWQGRVPAEMLAAMVSACGITGVSAKPVAQRLRKSVDIPWDLAIAVHKERVVPRWEARVTAALPNTDKLSPDCFGALLSLTYNRGPSFNKSGDRYREMRAIRTHMMAQNFAEIPDEFRSMKRLWKLAGLRRRRDTEAKLFEKGLRSRAPALADSGGRPARPDVVKDDATPLPAVGAPHGEQSGQIELVQKRLKAFGYHEMGETDGKWGGRTAAAIAAFKNDRKLTGEPVIDDALIVALDAAETEGWNRPIAKERAEATPEKVSEKIETVNASKASKLWAWVLGIPSAITAFVKGIADNFETALESPMLNTIKEFFADNVLYIALGIVGVAGVIWYQSRKAENGTVKAFQEGRLT